MQKLLKATFAFLVCLLLISDVSAEPNVIVKEGPNINGTVTGSVQYLGSNGINFNN